LHTHLNDVGVTVVKGVAVELVDELCDRRDLPLVVVYRHTQHAAGLEPGHVTELAYIM